LIDLYTVLLERQPHVVKMSEFMQLWWPKN